MTEIKTAIFLADGFEMAEAVISIDVLRRAQILVDIISVNENNLVVTSNNNLLIKGEKLINEINFNDYQALILPGGRIGVDNLYQNELLKTELLKANEQKKIIAAICAAPEILGQLKIVDNKQVTSYPGCSKGLQNSFLTDEEVVIADNIITAKAVGGTFNFALTIVQQLLSSKVAKKVKEEMIYNK